MQSKFNGILIMMKERLFLFLAVSIGVFLFILFFQPFPAGNFEFNNQLLFLAGFGLIVFLVLYLVHLVLFIIWATTEKHQEEPILKSYLTGFLSFLLCVLSFAFYLHYVGKVPISFFLVFKAALICIVPPIIVHTIDLIRKLRKQLNSFALNEKNDEVNSKEKHSRVVLISDNGKDKLKFSLSDFVLVRSADNYVELIFKEGDEFKSEFLRNTLKNMEYQLQSFPELVRCHRMCIINVGFVERMGKRFNNYFLVLKAYKETIPVSRQYLLKVKEAI